MQALSFVVHIPLVCFGIAFPAMFLFVHGLYLRTGEAHYKALAKRWSKVALILFAVGVVTGTILSFEFGLLWPDFMATFGEVFGLAFGLEGVSFFIEAIFIAIYVYGWDRLPPRTHFLTGIPVVIAGFAGSFNVIAVNGWMNHPQGFDVANGQVVDPQPWTALLNGNMWHELVHMYLAGYLVAGFIVAGVYAAAHLRGRRDAYHRTGLVVALSFAALAAPVQVDRRRLGGADGRREPAGQARRDRGAAATRRRARRSRSAAGTTRTRTRSKGGIEIPKLLSMLADARPERDRPGPRHRAARRPPAGQRRPLRVPRRWSGSGRCSRCSGPCSSSRCGGKRRLPRSPWFYRALMAAGPLALVALIAGWITTEVGRQPWIVYEVMRVEDAVTGNDGLELGFVAARRSSTSGSAPRSSGCCGGSPRSRPSARWRRADGRRSASALIVLGLTAYGVLGGADFGAGFWDLTAGGARARRAACAGSCSAR